MPAYPLHVLVRRICEPGTKARVDGVEAIVQRPDGKEIWRGPGSVLVQAVREKLAVRVLGDVAWVATPAAHERRKGLDKEAKELRGFRPGTPRLQSRPGAYSRPTTRPINYRPMLDRDDEPR